MKLFKKVLREPLLHFLVIGVGLFLLFSIINGPAVDKPNRIVLSQNQKELLAENFSRTWMRAPSDKEMEGLIDGYLRDEVFYREAIALGLDQGDNLIKRRLRQKLEFILEDVSSLVEPTDEELTLFMQQHKERFHIKPQVSFQQVYLNYDKHDDIGAQVDKLLIKLRVGENPEQLGDQTMLAVDFELISQTDIERRFGEEFARQVVSLPQGVWSGPVASGLGLHLILVSEKVEGRLPELAEVKKAVKRDWLVERRKELKEATFSELLKGYEVVIEQPEESDPVGNKTVSLRSPETGVR